MIVTPWAVEKREDGYFIVTRTVGFRTEIWTDGRAWGVPYWGMQKGAEEKAAQLNPPTIDLSEKLLPS